MEPLKFARLCGWLGLLAACLVGCGEFLLQYTPNGGYESGYEFFAEVPTSRLTIGHFISVLAAPLYLMGYWHLAVFIDRNNSWVRRLFFCLGAYGFIIGAAWISQRVFLALTVHEIAAGQNLESLQVTFAAHNEPLINVLRVAILVLSLLWVFQILKGRAYYPKWMALFSPLALLIFIVLLYNFIPLIGNYLLPVAMNAAHLIIFALSLWTTRKIIMD